jgi:hypothetical protein
MSRLAEIYNKEKGEGRSRMSAFGSSIGKGIKETIDPRQLLDQKGLLVSMFPSLKAFNATGEKKEKIIDDKRKVSLENLDKLSSKQLFQKILITSQSTVKNTSVLPAAAKDLKGINATLLKLLEFAQAGGFGNQGDSGERSLLDTILDSLGLGDLIPDKEGGGKRGRRKGAKERLKRMQQARAARTAAEAAATAGTAAASRAPTAAAVGAVAGKAKMRFANAGLGALSVALSAFNLWSDLDAAEDKFDGSQKTDKDKEELRKAYGAAIGGAIGGSGGGIAGAAGVGAVSAALGLTLTPIGSLALGIVGSTAGFFAGDAIGRYLGNSIADLIFGGIPPKPPVPLRFNEAEQKELKKALESEDTRKKISPELLKQLDYLANADLTGKRNPMAARMIRDTAGPEALQKLSEELRAATARDNPPSADIP